MKLGLAYASMVALGIFAVTLAGFTLFWTLEGSVRIEVGRAHGLLTGLDTRLADAYVAQIGGTDESTVLTPTSATLDLFARGLTSAVLEPYDGIEGGFYDARRRLIFGYAFPTHGGPRAKLDVPHVESRTIASLGGRVVRSGRPASTELHEGLGDVVAIDATPIRIDRRVVGAAWTMERLSGAAAPAEQRRRLLVVAIAVVALALVAFGIWVLARIRREVALLIAGVRRLETDDDARISLGTGDLGIVGDAVNRMADIRIRAQAAARAAETDARRAERLASLGRMVANVAHEIRNPLNAMRLQVALLQRREPASSEIAGRVVHEIERLDSVVMRMLELGTTGSTRRADLDLRDVARRAVALLAPEADERDVRFALSLDAEPARVRGDAAALDQLAINLLKNAVEAADAGSTIDVVVDRTPRLCVRNVGETIALERMTEIFEPFATNKPQGTGLGLAIALEIAAWHDATLAVTSDDSTTTFTLHFMPRALETTI